MSSNMKRYREGGEEEGVNCGEVLSLTCNVEGEKVVGRNGVYQ